MANQSKRGPGRPRKDNGKVPMTFRLAPDVAETIRGATNQTALVEEAVRALVKG